MKVLNKKEYIKNMLNDYFEYSSEFRLDTNLKDIEYIKEVEEYLSDFLENDLKNFKLNYEMIDYKSYYELYLYEAGYCKFIIDITKKDFLEIMEV